MVVSDVVGGKVRNAIHGVGHVITNGTVGLWSIGGHVAKTFSVTWNV